MSVRFESSATNTRVLLAIPEGRLIRGRVKEITGYETFAEAVHPGKAHEWHELLHYGESGTGFAMCACGAHGIPYRRGEKDR